MSKQHSSRRGKEIVLDLLSRGRVFCKRACTVLGGVAAIMLLLAFTRIPFDAHRWLGTAGGLCYQNPEVILVLSGSGMPSGPELMRCDEAARWARRAPRSQVLLVLPKDTVLAAAMVHELGIKGVSSDRITLLMHGRNTREQAMDVATNRSELLHRHTAIVTAPENMYRSLRTFRKLGFTQVSGAPTFDHALFDDLRYAHRSIGGKPYIPDVSSSTDLRYNFWNQLKLEITCLREYVALAYYKLNGWI
ncbi:MAG: ElyC/SanA/YdcF family protein [Flavobacteriales bacterium]|nr:YdcF family protein [Flavobacteriales bacterium]